MRADEDAQELLSMHRELTPVRDQPSPSPAGDAYRLRRGPARVTKRLLDLSLAVPVVVCVLPLLCVLVKLGQLLQSAGPLFYRQKRCGRDGAEFTIFKFRTMNVPAPGKTDIEENPGKRIYPIGTFLRRSKLDEIPQFINVLAGSMSVVGPRPHHFEDCEKFARQVPEYPLRSIAKPGITGLAQYTEYRGNFEWNCVQSRVAKDLIYIRDWSPYVDIQLIAKTVNIVARRIGSGVLRRVGIPVSSQKQPAPRLALYAPAEADDRNAAASESAPLVDTAPENRAA